MPEGNLVQETNRGSSPEAAQVPAAEKPATAAQVIVTRPRTREELLTLGDYTPPRGLSEYRASDHPEEKLSALEAINTKMEQDAIAAALKKHGSTVALPADIESLPPLAKGAVRLYRGEPSIGRTVTTTEDLRGRWFAETPTVPQRFADKSPAGVVCYVDIPKTEAVSMLDPVMLRRYPGGETTISLEGRHYHLTQAWAEKAKPIKQVVAAQSATTLQDDILRQGKE